MAVLCECPTCRLERRQKVAAAATGFFVLDDPTHVLDRETFLTVTEALDRATVTPWTAVPWRLYDPRGQLAAHNPTAERPTT